MAVAKELTTLGKRKSFLQEFCASVTCQLLDVCPEDVCRDHVMQHLELEGGWDQCSAEQLQVLLHLSTLYSQVPPVPMQNPPTVTNPEYDLHPVNSVSGRKNFILLCLCST